MAKGCATGAGPAPNEGRGGRQARDTGPRGNRKPGKEKGRMGGEDHGSCKKMSLSKPRLRIGNVGVVFGNIQTRGWKS